VRKVDGKSETKPTEIRIGLEKFPQTPAAQNMYFWMKNYPTNYFFEGEGKSRSQSPVTLPMTVCSQQN